MTRRQTGFSLVEVVLAITLLGIIMALAYSGFRASTRATHSAEEAIERNNRVRVVHQFVRQQLARALPLAMFENDERERIIFEGESERVRFVAPMPGYLSYGGPYVQEFRLEAGDNGRDLVFSYAMLNGFEPEGAAMEANESVVLLEGIDDGEFSYIGFDEDGEIGDWDTLWETPTRVPLAVTIDLRPDESTRMEWPRLATPLRIDSGGVQPQALRPGDIIDPAVRHRLENQRR